MLPLLPTARSRREILTYGLTLAAGAGLGWVAAQSRWIDVSSRANADTSDDTPERRVKTLKLELPEVKKPTGATLVPAVRVGETLYISGNGPGNKDGKPITGKVGKGGMTVADAQEAARRVGLIILSIVRQELGSLDKVVRLVKTLGMVNCTPEFTQQPAVINGFSDLMVQVFGDKAGKGARSAVGMVSLPGGIPVEIECIFQVKA